MSEEPSIYLGETKVVTVNVDALVNGIATRIAGLITRHPVSQRETNTALWLLIATVALGNGQSLIVILSGIIGLSNFLRWIWEGGQK